MNKRKFTVKNNYKYTIKIISEDTINRIYIIKIKFHTIRSVSYVEKIIIYKC